MAALLVLNGKDYSQNILMPSYTVNNQPLYEEWQDANGVMHRKKIRDKVSGTFDMFFNDIDEYAQFFNYVYGYMNDTLIVNLTVYVNNLRTTKTAQFFINIDPANNEPKITEDHDSFTVEIQEV